MRHKKAGRKLGRTSAHKKALLRNLVTSLILHDRIETTLAKAMELKRWADKMVTLAKKNTLHARRQAMSILKDKAALQKLFSTLVDRYKDRAGGYTRVLKLGFRHGDNAAMAIVEYLTAEIRKAVGPSKGKKTEASKKAKAGKKAVHPKAEKRSAPVARTAKKAPARKKAGKAKEGKAK